MPWIQVGTLLLTYEWQLFDQPLIDNVLIRLNSQISGPIFGTGLFAQVFPDGEFYSVRKFYPVQNPSMFVLKVPEELRNAGILSRNFAARLSRRSYITQTWQLLVEEFVQTSNT